MSGTAKLVTNLVGTRLGDRYVLEEKIGSGGFAVVYRARDTRIHKQVAIKVLDRAKVQNLRDIARFRNEAAIAASIEDEHIIKITDYGEEGTIFYYVMELLRGHTLRGIITMHDRLHWQRACDICEQVCLALELAHERTIIHRDVKPENIFVEFRRGAENVKLLDLGIAKVLQEWDGLVGNLSSTGDFIGSPSYMAPEQARGTKYCDFRVDLYALGIVLYELVTGTVPFRGESAWETMLLHKEQPPPPIARRAPDVECPPELEAVIMRALAKEPAERYQTATELGEAIRAVRTSRPALPWTPLWHPSQAPDSFPHGQTKVSGDEALAKTTPADQKRPDHLSRGTALADASPPLDPAEPATAPVRAPETVPARPRDPETVPARPLGPATVPAGPLFSVHALPLRWRTRLLLGYLTLGSLVATCATSTLATVTLQPDVLDQLKQRPRRVHVLNTEPPDDEPISPPAPATAPVPAPTVAAAPADTHSPFDRLLLAPPEPEGMPPAGDPPAPATAEPAPGESTDPATGAPAKKPAGKSSEPASDDPAPTGAKKKPAGKSSEPAHDDDDLLQVKRRRTMAAIAREANGVVDDYCKITPFSPLKEAPYTVVFRVHPTTGVIESVTPVGELPPLRNPDCVKDRAKAAIKSFAGAGDLKPEYRHTYKVVR